MIKDGTAGLRRGSALEHDARALDASPAKFARDVNRLVYAWSEASTNMWLSSVYALSNLFIDVNDTVAQSQQHTRRARNGLEHDTARREQRGQAAEEGLVQEYSRTLVGLSTIYSHALDEMVRVFRFFYQRLSDIYRL